MNKITTPNTNFGFFGWNAVAEVSMRVLLYLAGLGLLQLLQRSPATNAEKKLAGYEKRPKNFERSSIPFNDANKGVFASLMGAVVELVNGEEGKPDYWKESFTPGINCWYHPLGETTAPKFVEEIKIVKRHIESKDIEQWAKDKIGFQGNLGDKPEENTELLIAVKAFVKKLTAGA